jgi:hypothetical protein
VSARLLTALLPDPVGMLTHLPHFEVTRSADALEVLAAPALADVWVVFHFPDTYGARKPKAILYGRMWAFRQQGVDAMVRQLASARYVLVCRRFG